MTQILSNEERRANFDRYGQMEDNQAFGHSQQQGYRSSFHNSFYFDESFFHFPKQVNSTQSFMKDICCGVKDILGFSCGLYEVIFYFTN